MIAKILLGIDLGTTVLKICACDMRTGVMLAQAARRLPVRSFPHGGREQTPSSIDRTFTEIVTQLQTQLGGQWRQISGIGLAAQGGSSLIVNRSTGKPLTSMILWNDGRAQNHIARLAANNPVDFWRKFTLNDIPPDGLGRLWWLKETRPDLFRKENLHIGAGEYLYFKLTDIWRQDAGNAIQIGSYHAGKKQLDPQLFNLLGIPLSFVAPLRNQHETSPLSQRGARFLALPQGIPVAGPYIDQEAGYLSTLGVTSHPLQCSLGTAWVGNFVLPEQTNGSSPFQLVIPSPVDDGRLVIQPLLTGNTAWDWGLQTLLDSRDTEKLEYAETLFQKSLLPPDGLLVLPWFSQPNSLFKKTYGSGAFFGVSDQTTREDQLRALAAGMTFELARVFDAVKRSGVIDGLVLGGGAGKGVYFRKLITALFSPLPVFWQEDEEFSVARGAMYAFDRKTSQIKAKRIQPPTEKLQNEIGKRYEPYLALFEKLYSPVRAGNAFRFGGRKK
jgi:sugar (pentulose or hexulose) kinase